MSVAVALGTPDPRLVAGGVSGPRRSAPGGQPATTATQKGRGAPCPLEAPRAAQDRWCDAEGTRITLFCWVEQVAEHPEHGALFSRLHQHGQVVGRGPDVLYVRFPGEAQLISVLPELVCLLPDEPDEHGC